RFFDRVEFYPVSGEELCAFRDAFLEGKSEVEIAPGRFRLKDYLDFLAENAASIAEFKARQQVAFEAERARWQQASEHDGSAVGPGMEQPASDTLMALGATAVESPGPGSVWKILVEPGRKVAEGETLIIVEWMRGGFS